MNTTLCAALSLTASLAPLLALALRDPKRLRSQRASAAQANLFERRLLAALLLLPGLTLAMLGQWPAFLIWIGGVTAGGWLVVQALAGSQTQR